MILVGDQEFDSPKAFALTYIIYSNINIELKKRAKKYREKYD